MGAVFVSHTSRIRSADEIRSASPEGLDTPNKHANRKRYLRNHLLPALGSMLREYGREAWYDLDRIRPGDEFEPAIAHALLTCEAALILVDRDALSSGFMRDEAQMLGWRLKAEHDFIVRIVLLGDVNEKEFADSSLGRTPCGALSCSTPEERGSHKPAAAPRVARQIIESLPARLGAMSSGRVAAHWVSDVAHFLADVPPHVLDDVEVELDITASAARFGTRRERVAAALLRTEDGRIGYDRALAVLRRVEEYLSAPARAALVKRLVPLWADVETAQLLHEVCSRPAHRRLAAVVADASLRAEHALARANASDPLTVTCRLPGRTGEDLAAELVERCDVHLRDFLCLDPETRPKEVRALLEDEQQTYVALIPSLEPRRSYEAARTLVHRFPGVVFVLVSPRGKVDWSVARLQPLALPADEDWELISRRRIRQVYRVNEEVPDFGEF
ncbi:hypothetical protein [Actinomycetospora aeridis]|uniref:TIR domain-containing protein n=1 Tax=Actinomycetospora aeridis TaxID=3129231 RepID=A0ABU8N4P3_9PSEU